MAPRGRETWATPPGTGNAYGPILWRALVAQGRRNARKGVGHRETAGGLRYVLIPGDNPAPAIRPDRPKRGGDRRPASAR